MKERLEGEEGEERGRGTWISTETYWPGSLTATRSAPGPPSVVSLSLSRRFSCLGTTDRDVLVNELHSLLGAQLSREGCEFFLEIGSW